MPKVRGVERFADAMSNCEGSYVLIGGGACSVLFDSEGDSFRATEDLDVVVIVDRNCIEFATALWAFIKSVGYEIGKTADGKCTYYRFRIPEGSRRALDYPGQIELFARHPDFTLEDETSEVAPLSFDGAISSLSAIILDDGYYDFIRDNATNIGGITLLDALHIIPLKMRAHIDINRSYEEGRHCNDIDRRKHRSDVARLAGLLSSSARLELTEQMRADAEDFFTDFASYVNRQTNRKERARLQDTLLFLKKVYL
ncbi:hypothetical protein PMX13_05340 [Collinsella aerofaciens]|uniref:hypothetical protein n=1 Tax=Collinsella aerofaciens TaxID=74426 RepID=UPI00189F7D91|nr:hypothetical protein [Collinsella aerofaciens]MDB1859902.1 hypothetical protein [Collinsella aerofaciens]